MLSIDVNTGRQNELRNAAATINGNGNSSSNMGISAIMARQLRFGGNGTLSFHISEDAVLPSALQTKLSLVE